MQGLFIPYIEGDNLWNVAGSATLRPELLKITYRIVKIAARLERTGVYHEDLKCQNIIRRDSDGTIFFIDFGGGITEGFYREEV